MIVRILDIVTILRSWLFVLSQCDEGHAFPSGYELRLPDREVCSVASLISFIYFLPSSFYNVEKSLNSPSVDQSMACSPGNHVEEFGSTMDVTSTPVFPSPRASLDDASSPETINQFPQDTLKPSPLIMVTTVPDSPNEALASSPSISNLTAKDRRRAISDQNGTESEAEPPMIMLAYNEYGELVELEKLRRPRPSAELSVTETLRLINRAYHYEVREYTGEQPPLYQL